MVSFWGCTTEAVLGKDILEQGRRSRELEGFWE